ncbi:MAG: tetratricopeptide repeat protein [Bryobacteraceae bacterium]
MTNFLLALALGTTAASGDWDREYNAGKAAYRANDTAVAQRRLERAVSLAEQFAPPDARRARAWNDLGAVLFARGAVNESAEAYARAIKEWRGSDDVSGMAATLNNLSIAERHRGRLDEAWRLAVRAMEILEPVAAAPSQRARIQQNMAEIARLRGDLDTAEHALQAASPSDPRSRCHLLQTRAAVAMDKGEYGGAARLAREAIAVADGAFGAASVEAAGARATTALALFRGGDPGQAEALLLRAASIYETELGDSHPRRATVLNNLAQVYRTTGRLAEAEPLLRRAVAIWREHYGSAHPDVARGVKNLGDLFAQQGKVRGAEMLYREALPMAGRTPVRGEVADSLIRLLESAHRGSEARRLRRELTESGVRTESR